MNEVPPDIEALVRERRKIEAIKELRQRTGLGLKEAKDRLDLLERQLGIRQPSAPAQTLLFWIVLIVVGVLVWWGASLLEQR